MSSNTSLFDLRGKVALVTGATGGLGLSICQTLAVQGADVIVSDKDEQACTKIVGDLHVQGCAAIALAADLSDLDAIKEHVKVALAWRDRIDILVCNAGIQGPSGPLSAVSAFDWQSVVDLNLRAPMLLTNAVCPSMSLHGGGSVILMSSIAGLRGNKSIGLYGISKAALAQLARNLAVEWGPSGIRINAISPGLIRTPLASNLLQNQDFMQRRLAMTPLRRIGEPQEIAGVVAMLASRAGAFMTGQNLIVDGGTLISDGQ